MSECLFSKALSATSQDGKRINQGLSLTFITIRNQKRGNFKYSILVLSDLFLEDLGSRPLEIQDFSLMNDSQRWRKEKRGSLEER